MDPTPIFTALIPAVTAMGPFASIAVMFFFAWLYTNSTKRDNKAQHEKMDGIRDAVKGVHKRVDEVKTDLVSLENKIDSKYVRQDIHAKDLDLLSQKIDEQSFIHSNVITALESQGFNGGRKIKNDA